MHTYTDQRLILVTPTCILTLNNAVKAHSKYFPYLPNQDNLLDNFAASLDPISIPKMLYSSYIQKHYNQIASQYLDTSMNPKKLLKIIDLSAPFKINRYVASTVGSIFVIVAYLYFRLGIFLIIPGPLNIALILTVLLVYLSIAAWCTYLRSQVISNRGAIWISLISTILCLVTMFSCMPIYHYIMNERASDCINDTQGDYALINNGSNIDGNVNTPYNELPLRLEITRHHIIYQMSNSKYDNNLNRIKNSYNNSDNNLHVKTNNNDRITLKSKNRDKNYLTFGNKNFNGLEYIRYNYAKQHHIKLVTPQEVKSADYQTHAQQRNNERIQAQQSKAINIMDSVYNLNRGHSYGYLPYNGVVYKVNTYNGKGTSVGQKYYMNQNQFNNLVNKDSKELHFINNQINSSDNHINRIALAYKYVSIYKQIYPQQKLTN